MDKTLLRAQLRTLGTLLALTAVLVVGGLYTYNDITDSSSEIADQDSELSSTELVQNTGETQATTTTESESPQSETSANEEANNPSEQTGENENNQEAEELEEVVEQTKPPLKEPAPSTSVDGATLLATQNAARQAKGVAPLTWSANLAASAQAWADNLGARGCAFEHSTTPYGENIHIRWTAAELKLDPSNAVAAWLSEESSYDYTSNSCAPGQQCGHYTQVVWAHTTSVGCGVTTCATPGKKTQLWVCQYSPAGNIAGQRPY